ncbi:MAG TPA: site-2 protease family protein [Jatrophihabitans sp.]|nr:site-2 protease family protein [Jatrophihabitans sp.]
MSLYELGKRRRAVRPSPLFLVVLAITALGAVIAWTQQGVSSRFGDFGVLLLVLGGWVVTVCFHEFAHAYAAYRAGDRSVEAQGYLTLNPFKYAHPVLSILLPLVAIIGGGFALPGGAVYLHTSSFRSKHMRALAAAAGPLTNIVFAVALVLISANQTSGSHVRFWAGLAFLGFLQITAAILNLVPIPGLDGYAIAEPYLDAETRRIGDKVKPWGLLVVLVLLFYATPLRNAFFDLVDAIYRGMGGTELLQFLGSQFFKFWSNAPLGAR